MNCKRSNLGLQVDFCALGQLLQAHLPGWHAHFETSPPHAQFVLSVPATGVAVVLSLQQSFCVLVLQQSFSLQLLDFGQLLQAHFPDSQEQTSLFPPQEHTVKEEPGARGFFDLPFLAQDAQSQVPGAQVHLEDSAPHLQVEPAVAPVEEPVSSFLRSARRRASA